MRVVLFEPKIPQNTGNIVRTCSVTGCGLILVEPLGFSVTDRWLKRAGLDYWEGVEVEKISNLEAFLQQTTSSFTFFSSHATKLYTQEQYAEDHLLIFGSEDAGLPALYHERWPERFVKLPMRPGARCLNLATTVGIAVYHGLYGSVRNGEIKQEI